MTDKNETNEQTPITLTLVIPTDGSGQTMLTGKKGDVGICRQVDFADANDLAQAIQEAAWDMVNMEIAPPAIPEVVED